MNLLLTIHQILLIYSILQEFVLVPAIFLTVAYYSSKSFYNKFEKFAHGFVMIVSWVVFFVLLLNNIFLWSHT